MIDSSDFQIGEIRRSRLNPLKTEKDDNGNALIGHSALSSKQSGGFQYVLVD
jgi:hypothetical protein